AGVGVAYDEAVRVEGEEDVAQRALGDLERSCELRDALRPSTLGERAQDARGLLDRRHRTEAPRTVRHTRTEHSTPAETRLTLVVRRSGSRLAHASRPGGTYGHDQAARGIPAQRHGQEGRRDDPRDLEVAPHVRGDPGPWPAAVDPHRRAPGARPH